MRPFASVRCCICSGRLPGAKARNPDLSQIPQSQFQSSLSCRLVILTNATIRPKKQNKIPPTLFCTLPNKEIIGYYHMGGSAKWKMHKIRSQRIRGSRVSSQRIHGSRLDLDRMIRISGNLPPHLQSRSRSAGNMPGSASSSGEPMCALKDSVTVSYSIACVDGLGGDEDG